jgi:hypothetical protein
MDPLTALSVAGTIVQFVDFGNKLLTSSVELYKSSQGLLQAHEELELVTGDLISVVAKLRDIFPASVVTHAGNHGLREFHTICEEAIKIAGELLVKLNNLKIKDGKHRAWESLKAAVKAAWSKDEIKSLTGRLSTLKESLQTRAMLSLGYDTIARALPAIYHLTWL